MAVEPRLILQVPRNGAVDRNIRQAPPEAVQSDDAVVEAIQPDAEGNLDPPDVGEVVLSVPSPETLARESDEVRRVIAEAGHGVEPLVVEVEAAEEIRDEELASVLAATEHTERPVIVRIIRDA
jgi:hypothetical protein